jgi:hypothetical protein
MSFINTTPAADAEGAVLDMYRRQEEFWGHVPNYAKPFSHRPEVMARWGRMLAEIRRPVDDRRFEIVTLAVALELKHSACSLAHGKKLAGIIGDDDVIRIANGEDTKVLTETEIAIMAFARKIARDASKITRGEVEVLTKTHGLSDEDVFDIAAIASARCFFTKILDALGVEPDSNNEGMDRTLREALVVGRPISVSTPELTSDAA